MKSRMIPAVLVALIATVLIVEESRIRTLQRELDATLVSPTTDKPGQRKMAGKSPRGRIETPGSTSAREHPEDRESDRGNPMTEIGKAMRNMADNPAAKAMFVQAHKGPALNIYASLIEEFDLNEEEKDYFITLLAGEFAQQQEMGMKLMGAQTPAEREELTAAFEQSSKELKDAVKEFLNDDEDHEKYEHYHQRLAEHQQLPGIKAAMDGAGAPLRPDQESLLIEAMFEARTRSSSPGEWEGAAGMKKIQEENAVEQFEQNWAKNQETIQQKVRGILDEDQLPAFNNVQEQMKEFNLMGIKMMQGMMQSQEKQP